MKNTFYPILFCCVTLLACTEKPHPVFQEIKPVINISLMPGSDTLNLGDTLTLKIDFPESVLDSISGRYIEMKNFDFLTVLTFLKLANSNLGILEQPGNASDYEFVNSGTGGIFNSSTTYADLKLTYINNRYSAISKIVLNRRGVMAIFPFYAAPNGENISVPLDQINLGLNSEGVQKFATCNSIKYILNNNNTHFNIYKMNCKYLSFLPDSLNLAENFGTYTFVVK